jgi:hypothetical protein
MLPEELRDPLEQDDLTGCLQNTLAALADVEFGFQIDCERLEEWSGPAAEKEHILRQLESKRQRQRDLLNGRLDQLQQRATRLISPGPSSEAEAMSAATATAPSSTIH